MTNREKYLQTLAELKTIGEAILNEGEFDAFVEEVEVMDMHLECAQFILNR